MCPILCLGLWIFGVSCRTSQTWYVVDFGGGISVRVTNRTLRLAGSWQGNCEQVIQLLGQHQHLCRAVLRNDLMGPYYNTW